MRSSPGVTKRDKLGLFLRPRTSFPEIQHGRCDYASYCMRGDCEIWKGRSSFAVLGFESRMRCHSFSEFRQNTGENGLFVS